jgi:hypothetical protein
VAWTLDLGPLVLLQKRMWRAAFFTGLAVYLQALAAFVYVTEYSLSLAALAVILAIVIGQLIVVYRPAKQFVKGRLFRSYQIYLWLVAAYVVTVWLGSPSGIERLAGFTISMLLAALAVWAAISTLRMARAVGPQLVGLRDDTVLLQALSFSVRDAVEARLRSFGGDRQRWVVLGVAAGATFLVSVATLSLVFRALGIPVASPVAQVSVLIAAFVFYIGMRRIKLSASQLRERDPRPPVLILRQFGDDFLDSGRMSFGATPTFEHFVVSEFNRLGPVVAIGRPGERLQPLGASRDYLNDPDWHQAVGAAIADAALVVFVLGDSDSLSWEFRTTIETRGKRRVLIIVPPLGDRSDLARRWARFAHASADLLGSGFPGELPTRSVLAIGFAGDDAVMMVSDERPRGRAPLLRSRSDYRLTFRVFERVLGEDPPSAQALDLFLRRTLPIVKCSGLPNDDQARRV